MKFDIEEIDEKQLYLLGISKSDIRNLPETTLNVLENGGRTSLIKFDRLNVPGLEGMSLRAKLSLERKADNGIALRFHPYNKVPRNTFQLEEAEIKQLEAGEIRCVEKEFQSGKYLVFLDKETNEYVAVNKKNITAPERINGIALTQQQAEDFKEGKEISVMGEKVGLKPCDESGIASEVNQDFIKSLEFKHSKYTFDNMIVDIALLSTGLGHFVMLGHLLNVVINTSNKTFQNLNEVQKKALQDAVVSAAPELAERQRRGGFIPAEELKQIVERHFEHSADKEIIKDVVFKEVSPITDRDIFRENIINHELLERFLSSESNTIEEKATLMNKYNRR